MYRYRFLFALLIAAVTAQGQSPYAFFNSDTFWRRLVADPPGLPLQLQEQDTVLIMASTRAVLEDELRFMAEWKGSAPLNYFLVYSSGGKWHVRKTSGLGEALRYLPDPDKDWVIYTEGMGKLFTSNADRGMQMAAQYDVHVLLFDYPSIRTTYKPLKNYRFARSNARMAYQDFIPLLDSVKAYREAGRMGRGNLSLFFHSMGNHVIRELAIHKKLGGYNDHKWVNNLILNAPCVPARKHTRWVDSLRFADRVYIHYNPDDGALKWARIAGFRQILGAHTKKPLSMRAAYINFNGLCGPGHSNFLSLYGHTTRLPEAEAHYYRLLHGDTAQLHNRAMYKPSLYKNIGWDILPAAGAGI